MTIKILLVDDQQLIRSGIKSLLTLSDNVRVVAEACDGSEVVPIIEKNDIDVILLDLSMPIMNGIEFLEIIRKDDTLKQIPVVVHTTSSNIEDYKTLKSIGISGYYVKHIDFSTYKSNLITIADYWNNSYRN